MQRLSTHIEKLLLFNDCVIIPGFGGFVLQNHPAVYYASRHTFLPPYKEIVFNSTLDYNDGLLIESYMQSYGMDFNRAQTTLNHDVDDLKNILDENGSVILGTIGNFYKRKETLLFNPSNEISNLNISAFGLSSLYIPPIAKKKEYSDEVFPYIYQKETSKKTIYLSTAFKFISRTAGVAAVAIILFFVFSTPVKEVNMSAYTASFIPSEIIPTHMDHQYIHSIHIIENVNSDDKCVNNIIDKLPLFNGKDEKATTTSFPSGENHYDSNKFAAKNESLSSLYPEIETVERNTYYVIVASFVSDTQLERYFSNTDLSSLKNMGVVKNNERIRIYADKTVNRKDAEAYIDLLRKNEKYKDAWLFIGR